MTSTFILLATYAIVILCLQSYAGIGTTGIGLSNPNHNGRRAVGARHLHFRHLGLRHLPHKLLVLMVLSSAAASTQTTILPTARTTLSMAVFKAIPSRLRDGSTSRFLTPTVSTLAMGGVSIALYVP